LYPGLALAAPFLLAARIADAGLEPFLAPLAPSLYFALPFGRHRVLSILPTNKECDAFRLLEAHVLLGLQATLNGTG